MHGASFRPRILAGYALRALSWHDLRSVRSFLHARSAFPASFRGFRHARSAIPATSGGWICALCIPPRARACTARHSCQIFWRDMRSVHSPTGTSMHGASFRLRLLAGYTLRALSWHDLRSVRSFLHARSAFPASFRGFRYARSAFPATFSGWICALCILPPTRARTRRHASPHTPRTTRYTWQREKTIAE